MSDRSDSLLSNAASSRSVAFAITPSNDDALAVPAKAIAFKTAGALHILDGEGNEVTIPSGVLAVGVIHNISVTKVFATGSGSSMDLWGFA